MAQSEPRRLGVSIELKPHAYDPATEVTYGGIVSEVVPTKGSDGSVGVHLTLATARGVAVKVQLGPAVFIGMNDASFIADDQVLVTGAFVTHDGDMALWARQITKDGRTITLRSPDGTLRVHPGSISGLAELSQHHSD